MWEMPYLFDKRIKYVGNDVDIWEMAKIFLKLLRYLGHSSSILERHKYVGNIVNILNIA